MGLITEATPTISRPLTMVLIVPSPANPDVTAGASNATGRSRLMSARRGVAAASVSAGPSTRPTVTMVASSASPRAI